MCFSAHLICSLPLINQVGALSEGGALLGLEVALALPKWRIKLRGSGCSERRSCSATQLSSGCVGDATERTILCRSNRVMSAAAISTAALIA